MGQNGNGHKNSDRSRISMFRSYESKKRKWLMTQASECGIAVNNRGQFTHGTSKESIYEFVERLKKYNEYVKISP